MEKALILERLKATRTMMDTLKEEQFNYGNFIYEFENECGTVCCIAGWYPKWFPDSGLKWGKIGDHLSLVSDKPSYIAVFSVLSKFHGLNELTIFALFAGRHIGKKIKAIGTAANLDEVKVHWDKIIKAIENEEITYKL